MLSFYPLRMVEYINKLSDRFLYHYSNFFFCFSKYLPFDQWRKCTLKYQVFLPTWLQRENHLLYGWNLFFIRQMGALFTTQMVILFIVSTTTTRKVAMKFISWISKAKFFLLYDGRYINCLLNFQLICSEKKKKMKT